MTRRILVCGDRKWRDKEAIRRVLSQFPSGTVIIHGGCGTFDMKDKVHLGADRLAGIVASELGFKVEEFLPDWARYGRAAGPVRNAQMLSEGRPDTVIAFHRDLKKSKGTKNMVNLANKAKIKVMLWEGD